jgi:hypothetical protein
MPGRTLLVPEKGHVVTPTRPVPQSIGKQIGLSVITLGFYGIYWAYKSHEDIKQEVGDGVGGVIGAIIYTFVGVITWFLLPLEIKKMYEAKGMASPVGAGTAFWILLLAVPWYVKCQSALNAYWAATATDANTPVVAA